MMRDVAAPEMDLPDDALEDGSLSTYLSFMAPEQYPSFRQHSAADDEVESVSQKGMISEHQPPYPPSGVEAGFLPHPSSCASRASIKLLDVPHKEFDASLVAVLIDGCHMSQGTIPRPWQTPHSSGLVAASVWRQPWSCRPAFVAGTCLA